MIAGPADILLQLLIDQNTLVEPANDGPEKWVGVTGAMPPTDHERCISIVDVSAWIQGRIQRTGEHISHPKVQMLIRAPNYPVGWDKGTAIIRNILEKLGPVESGIGHPIVAVAMPDGSQSRHKILAAFLTVPLSYLGQEKDTRRCVFSINLQLEYENPL